MMESCYFLTMCTYCAVKREKQDQVLVREVGFLTFVPEKQKFFYQKSGHRFLRFLPVSVLPHTHTHTHTHTPAPLYTDALKSFRFIEFYRQYGSGGAGTVSKSQGGKSRNQAKGL